VGSPPPAAAPAKDTASTEKRKKPASPDVGGGSKGAAAKRKPEVEPAVNGAAASPNPNVDESALEFPDNQQESPEKSGLKTPQNTPAGPGVTRKRLASGGVTPDMMDAALAQAGGAGSWEHYKRARLPMVLTWLLGATLLAIALLAFFSVATGRGCCSCGDKKFKGWGPMADGAQLKSGEYIASCNSAFNTTCSLSPKYFIMTHNGNLELRKGYTPRDKGAVLWSNKYTDDMTKSPLYVATYTKAAGLSVKKGSQKHYQGPKLPPEVLCGWPLQC